VRPKTGIAFTLPFLPAVAKALAFYLRDGRPPNIPHRYVFVRMKMPFTRLAASDNFGRRWTALPRSGYSPLLRC
jgi:hypothetical protein